MRIRQATKKDFLSIAALDREVWKQNEYSEFASDGEHTWRLWTDYALVFCALTDWDDRSFKQKIVGAVIAFPTVKDIYCIPKIFISSRYRGQGVGNNLLSVLLDKTDEIKTDVFLTVDPILTSAISLYKKYGFTVLTYKEGYYRPEEDRLIMLRRSDSISRHQEVNAKNRN